MKPSVLCFDNQFLGTVKKVEPALLLGFQFGGRHGGGVAFDQVGEALVERHVQSSDGSLRLGQDLVEVLDLFCGAR